MYVLFSTCISCTLVFDTSSVQLYEYCTVILSWFSYNMLVRGTEVYHQVSKR